MEQGVDKNIIGFDLGYKITHDWLKNDVTKFGLETNKP